MQFNGITINHIPTLTNIPQESSLSPILYILYNNNLLDIPQREKQLRLDYINNILYEVQNKMTMRNTKELK